MIQSTHGKSGDLTPSGTLPSECDGGENTEGDWRETEGAHVDDLDLHSTGQAEVVYGM